MFGKSSRLKLLETRKQLLLAESEVNRAELARELAAVKNEVGRMKKQLRAVGSMASSAALAATAISVFRRSFSSASSSNGAQKPSLISSFVRGARVGVSVWRTVKSFFR